MMYRKFEFGFTSDRWFNSVSPAARLIFIGLIDHADTACGTSRVSMKVLSAMFGFSEEETRNAVLELNPKVEWFADDDIFWVRNFFKHQGFRDDGRVNESYARKAYKDSCKLPEHIRREVWAQYPEIANSPGVQVGRPRKADIVQDEPRVNPGLTQPLTSASVSEPAAEPATASPLPPASDSSDEDEDDDRNLPSPLLDFYAAYPKKTVLPRELLVPYRAVAREIARFGGMDAVIQRLREQTRIAGWDGDERCFAPSAANYLERHSWKRDFPPPALRYRSQAEINAPARGKFVS